MPNKSQFKLVCFDFDQTIFDSGVGFSASYKVIAKEIKKILEDQNIHLEYTTILKILHKKDREYNKMKFYNRNFWWSPILKDLNSKKGLDEEECTRLTSMYWNAVIENSEPYPDTLEILNYLRGKYVLGLITDTDGQKGMKHLRIQKSNLAHYFDHILIPGEDTPEVKPSPEPFLKIAKMANIDVSKQECMMVGDKPFTDIKGAMNAGFTTVLILRTNWEIAPVPDYSIKKLSELKKLL
ncbi:MAG: HAD family hydrolase [Candidatus Helarchaeota archaeon]